ncbi:MAG: family 16 glycosylhydrolase [Cyclobacteriaceae bacterium]|nr:family 16 glycosylhydrolase [Cyclobacteriaceae bacterium]
MIYLKKILLAVSIFVVVLSSCKEDEQTNITGFSLESIVVPEGNDLQTQLIKVNIKGAVHSDVNVSYLLKAGSAKFGQDLIETAGDILFTANQTSVELPIEIIGDNHLELTEYFTIVLSYEGKQTELTISIQDDDLIEEILVDEDGFFTPAEYPSMHLAFSDEFTGTQLNTSVWTYELGGGGWGNNELQRYTNTTANARLEDGKLIITALGSDGNYTSARVKTQGKVKVKYGRIDVRAKLPKGQGIWPAIWMLGESITTVSWPACGEIDIMELVGHKPAQVHGTVHYSNGTYQTSSGSTNLSSGDFSEQFHVFSIVWDKNTITWYLDNKPFKTFISNVATFENDFFFLLNVAVGGNWPGSPNESTVFPQELIVDYVRVFQ